jgi:mRNA interferase MazF
MPKEPNRLRPAVVVEDDAPFDPEYLNVIVPLTNDERLAIGDLSVAIAPGRRMAASNGVSRSRHR